MGQCKHFEICGLSDAADPKNGFCILHSKDPEKDKKAFEEALRAHRGEKDGNFRFFVFPDTANFGGAMFTEEAYFQQARFGEEANFWGATFTKKAIFWGATFTKKAYFLGARFTEEANFGGAMFTERANFGAATFAGWANFYGVTFTEEANFWGAMFTEKAYFETTRFLRGALFQETLFDGGLVHFESSTFNGRTLFTSRPKEEQKEEKNAEGRPKEKVTVKIFSGSQEVNFKSVNLDLADSIIFREADLQRCLFQDTNLQKVQFTGVKWHDFGGRDGVYDEVLLKKGESAHGTELNAFTVS
jgi:uncharacterized protein YjbI with pentapeptide repeats